MIESRVFNTLIGFVKSSEDGDDALFNFILSNGARSTQRDGYFKYYDHMIPNEALNTIRSVTIHYTNCINGFSFFDKDKALLWKIGLTTWSGLKQETVLLEEYEVIVGLVAKLYSDYKSWYTDF